MTVTVNAASRRKEGTTKKDRHHAKRQEKEASKCKLTENDTEIGNISINEYVCSSIVTENIEDNSLPKIVEVYSLNSPKLPNEVTAVQKTNGQGSGRKRENQSVLSCNNEGTSKMNNHMPIAETSKNVEIQDSSLCTSSSRIKPYLVSDNFIDLTIGDEEETKSCSVNDETACGDESCSKKSVNADNQSEFDQTKEDNDNGKENKSNRRKRKGVFGNRRKGKSRCQAQSQQSTTSNSPKMSWVSSSCNSNNFIKGGTDKTTCVDDHENNYHDKCEQSLNDQNNNDWRKEEKAHKNTSCSSVNGGVNISLDMTYRENKITTLKARLAKQEEELSKLRTQNEGKLSKDKSLEAPLQDVGEKQKESDHRNSIIQCHDIQEEADTGEVNLDDICQHVIKSFDLFNARQCKGQAKRKEGFHTLNERNACILKQANGRKSDVNDLHYLQQGSQDEFLFQVGLRRRSLNAT